MGIYLPNMEMPVTCCHCPLMGYDPDIEWADGGRETQGAYICVITHELIDNTKREDHCPLVPVPPHGRLIDAGALFKRLFVGQDGQIYPNQGVDGWDNTYNFRVIKHEIIIAPTIIPAEENNNDR